MVDAAPNPEPPAPRRRRVWRVLGWSLLFIALVVGALGLWAWTQRYSLIERQVVAALEARGLEAELRIESATRTQADIRALRLQSGGKTVASAERLQLEYEWRDLLEGRVERVEADGARLRLTLDDRGRPVDPWIPQGSGGGGGFPARGVAARDTRVELATPFGPATLAGDANIASPERIDFDGRIESAELTRDDARVSASGPVSASRRSEVLKVSAPRLALSLLHPQGALRDTVAALSGTYDLDARAATGRAVFEGGRFSAAAGVDGEVGRVVLDGRYAPENGLRGDIDVDARAVLLSDPQRWAEVARTLSLREALSAVPVARNFAPQITAPLAELLGGSDVSGQFSAALTPEGRQLELRAPLVLEGERTTLTLQPVEGAALYSYSRANSYYDVEAEAQLSRPLPLTLSPLRVRVGSSNGIGVDGVQAASGRLQSRQNWRGQSPDGVPARLGPLNVRFDYANPESAPARLTLRGAADYDGDVPGGIVTGLDAGGRMDVALVEDQPAVSFTPDRVLRFARLVTTSDWGLRDFASTLEPTGPLFRRRSAARSDVSTALRDATFTAHRSPEAEGGPASLDISVGRATLDGVVGERTQDWNIAFDAATLRSETFPVEGTDLALPRGTVNVALSDTQRTRFALTAPSSVLVTPAYTVRGMALEASGTAEAYTLSYSGGRVRFAPTEDGTPLPVLPATGVLRFADGVFTGEAKSSLPRADEQPFDIAYRIVDGRGTADVTIRDLRFAPGRLQPQDLVPALKGKISLVEGAIDADLDVVFGGGQAPSGTGTLDLKGLSLGTAPGPVSGLRGTVQLTSLFPVVTAPNQELSVELFDPGFPLRDGVFRYALVDGGIDVTRAVWPLGEGRVSIDPFTWRYTAEENRVTLRVAGVEVGEFLDDIGDGRLSATGELTGAIPVVVRGLDVLVEGGRLEVVDGGYIRYQPPPGQDISERVPNRFAADALKALENFRYDALFAEINGPLGGEVKLGMEFTGTNEDVLFGVPFAFDVSVEGELFNIARSFNTNATIKRSVGAGVSVVE